MLHGHVSMSFGRGAENKSLDQSSLGVPLSKWAECIGSAVHLYSGEYSPEVLVRGPSD